MGWSELQSNNCALRCVGGGWHWWQWVDEPRGGRWPDGENSNYGVVDINDEPYAALGDAMRTANHAAEAVHARHSEATAEH